MCKREKKNILIVHNYYQLPGGEDTVVANEKKLLEENGQNVFLYSRHNNELKMMNIIEKIKVPFYSIFSLKTYRDIKKIIKKNNIDLIHVHNTMHLISPSVYYAAVRCNVPVVKTIHNFRLLCPSGTFYRDGHVCENCLEKGLYCALKHKCYRKSILQTFLCVFNIYLHRKTGIMAKINYICLTEFNKDKILNINSIKEEKIYVKPNFTYETDISNNSDKEYYLFVGRIEEIKGVRILIEAFSKMPSKKLILAGNGPLRKELEIKATENIKFLGKINHNSVMKLIAGAKALILPSQCYEGFPMTILEAMSVYTPVIVSDIGNNGILVDEKINGLKFLYNSSEELRKTIIRLEELDYEKLRKLSYDTFYKKYRPDINYKLLMNIYDNIK